jgi:glycerophosphoryl diester phosphodiesterase
MEIHPWTVNDPDALAPLLDRGVDNVITDVPAAMRARLDEIRALSAPERLLLRVRNLLSD